MKRNSGALALFFISLAILTIVLANQASGDIADMWMSRALSTETLESSVDYETSYSDPYCQKTEYSRYGIKNSQVVPHLDSVAGCWRTWPNGSVDGGSRGLGYIRTRKDEPLARVDGFYGVLRIAGQKVLSSDYRNDTIRVFEEPEKSRSIRGYNTGVYYQLDKPDGARWAIAYPQTGEALRFPYYTISESGKWLVGRSDDGYVRVNLDTKEILTFGKNRKGYGYGLDPTYGMAISNDGRHAVVKESDAYGSTVEMFDLATCAVDHTQYHEVAEGCEKRDIKTRMLTPGNTSGSVANFWFNPPGDMLLYYETIAGRFSRRVLVSGSNQRYGYVALGDSYSSGEGAFDGTHYYRPGTDRDGENYAESNVGINGYPYHLEVCHQSLYSYPYLLAASAAGATLGDVACSGATLNDILNTQTNYEIVSAYHGSFGQLRGISDNNIVKVVKRQAIANVFPGRAAQIEVLQKYQPRVATIGIGGNDVDFKGKLISCILSSSVTCSYAAEDRILTGASIKSMHARYLSLFRQLKAASPATRFYMVGYPQFISPATTSSEGACDTNVGLDTYERQYIVESVRYLNQIIKSAAKQSGVVYLDIEDSLEGHELCSDNRTKTYAVNGTDNGNDIYSVIGNESYHPNDFGHELMAGAIRQQLGGLSIVDFDACSDGGGLLCPRNPQTSVPAIPGYFLDSNASNQQSTYSSSVKLVISGANKTIEAVRRGTEVVIDTSQDMYRTGAAIADTSARAGKFASGIAVDMILHSEAVMLGTAMPDSNGEVATRVTIPETVPYGPHILILSGTNQAGEPLRLYQQIYVYKTTDDMNGNNIQDAEEKCGLIKPSLIDKDGDGTDDACDGTIYRQPDTAPPVVTAQLDRQPNDKGWHKDNVTITWKVTDAVDGDMAAPPEVTADQEGEHTYTSAPVCDTSNNCTVATVTVKLDKTAPVVTAAADTTPNTNGWYKAGVIIDWTVSDNIKTDFEPLPPTVATEEGIKTYTPGQLCDDAGNCTTGRHEIKLDTTAPEITASLSHQPNASGWHNTPPGITWRATDNLTPDVAQPPAATADQQGEHSYASPQVCDLADNCANKTETIKLDTQAPQIGDVTWDRNPKSVSEVAHMSVDTGDDTAGVNRAEYFIGDTDPGRGNGAPMTVQGVRALADAATDYPTGVYKLSVRAQDAADNWSALSSDYLVVYDPSSGLRLHGTREVVLQPGTGLPGVVVPTPAVFGMSIRYDSRGSLTRRSDFQFRYRTGDRCGRRDALNCHRFEINATAVRWLTVDGPGNSRATFRADGKLTLDGVTRPATLLVEAIDSERSGSAEADCIHIRVYSDPTDPFRQSPVYTIGPLMVARGSIKIGLEHL